MYTQKYAKYYYYNTHIPTLEDYTVRRYVQLQGVNCIGLLQLYKYAYVNTYMH